MHEIMVSKQGTNPNGMKEIFINTISNKREIKVDMLQGWCGSLTVKKLLGN